MKLKTKQQCPYGGRFDLNLPEKGMVGMGSDFAMLYRNICEWRRANGWPQGLGLEDEVEQETCLRYPQECIGVDERLIARRHFTISDVATGTRAFKNQVVAGNPLVSQEEADRRASICRACPMNGPIAGGCASCSAGAELLGLLVRGRTTPYDDKLSNCRICACFIKTAVHWALEPQWEALSQGQRDQFAFAHERWNCWKYPST
jgi:hypothetical protein